MNIARKHHFQVAVAKGFLLSLLLLLSRSRGGSVEIGTTNSNPSRLKRYVVFNDAAAAAAMARGAKLVLETRGLKAVVCLPDLAQTLGLQEDIPLQAADSAANTQVLATRAQEMGLTGRGRKIVVLDSG